jgi:hypothetical protein
MSSRDLSRVVELSFKAFELHEKRHYVRGVAKFAAATAAAQELAQEDCLIVVHLQLMHHLMLHGCAQTPGITAEAAAAAEKQSFELLLSVIATLERRRAAGTLVAGTCRRWPEEEWYGKFIQHRELLHKHPPYPPKRQALLAQFVGYDAYLYATAASLGALESQTSASSSEARAREVCGPFAVRGIDLLEQPRLKIWNDSSLASEDMLANLMQLFSETYSPILAKFGDIQPPESIHPMSEVLSRWQRCVRSGVLQKTRSRCRRYARCGRDVDTPRSQPGPYGCCDAEVLLAAELRIARAAPGPL